MGASGCGGSTGTDPATAERIAIRVNAISAARSELLVLPPSGFTVEALFPQPGQVVGSTLRITAESWTDGSLVDLAGHEIATSSFGTVFELPSSLALPIGSASLIARVEDLSGVEHEAVLDVAIRAHAQGPPLPATQTVWLDFGVDRNDDGELDLIGDLRRFGLYTDGSTSIELLGLVWVQNEIVRRSEAFYAQSNPSSLPGGDPIDVLFTATQPASGSYTRLCVGGRSPNGQPIAGNVLFDAGNANPSDVACDDFLPSGIFPGELKAYQSSSAYQALFGPLIAEPLGTLAIDAILATPDFDPSDPAQQQRLDDFSAAVKGLAQAVATITAHEAAHAMGLVPPGAPGRGLYGGLSSLPYTHNVEPDGSTTTTPYLMNVGTQLSFAQLAGYGDTPLPRFRAMNAAYLKGRLVLDAAVTGVFPPPTLETATPGVVDFGGEPAVEVTIQGDGFYADDPLIPTIALSGPYYAELYSPVVVDPQTIRAWLLTPMVIPGVYDLSVENPDGQTAMLPQAIVIE